MFKGNKLKIDVINIFCYISLDIALAIGISQILIRHYCPKIHKNQIPWTEADTKIYCTHTHTVFHK